MYLYTFSDEVLFTVSGGLKKHIVNQHFWHAQDSFETESSERTEDEFDRVATPESSRRATALVEEIKRVDDKTDSDQGNYKRSIT